ncbi:MAG: FAD-dependent oxidoreductase [Deltaproteobacteria bacterium]|nr:FAD-dependent oxidoreductase [Deltaproteobacteria bacterium]
MESSQKFPGLFQKGFIGSVEIKNRIVMAPMGTTFWGANGEVTEKLMDHYVARAKGGAGLITVSFAHPDYPSGYRVGASLESENMISGHTHLVNGIHSYGAKAALQIMHTGRDRADKGLDIVSSSPVGAINIGGSVYPIPRALKKNEIREMINRYVTIVVNAVKAGYDMVELHAAHGYLLNSFISTYLNKRDDEFGGCLENRMRFPSELLKEIRQVVGNDYPVGVRISGDEFMEGGITVKESPVIAQMLQQAGASFIDISAGMEEVKYRTLDIMRFPEGWKTYIWQAVRNAVSVPIIAGGNIRSPGVGESVISRGIADFIFLGRSLLADPEWPEKARKGREEEIRKCISCLECHAFRTGRAPGSLCALNVAVGREKEFGEITRAQSRKNVMVVGAGPAGMEAARVAALRGHDVTLYDRNNELGGNLLLAAVPPGKEKLLWIRDYETVQLKKLGVVLRLGTEVTTELINDRKPDAIIFASGSIPAFPDIKGIRNKNVITARDLLAGTKKLNGKRVVVVGGNAVGSETAELLAAQGNFVTIIEMMPGIAGDMEVINRRGLIDSLNMKKVEILVNYEVKEISDNGVIIVGRNGSSRQITADSVVLAAGSKPNNNLAGSLKGKIPHLYEIGDCKEPRNILAAFYEAARAAVHI